MSNGQEEIHFKYTLDCCLEEGKDSVAEVYITGAVLEASTNKQEQPDVSVCSISGHCA